MHHILNKLIYNRLTIAHRPFYKHYPYRGGVAIDSANARGCVDLELGVFCNRIPKAANSTIISNLTMLKYGREIPSKKAKKLFDTPASLSKQQMAQFDALFKFAVVRNPFTRTLSSYLEKVERRAANKGKQTSFKHFLHEVRDRLLYTNAHWAPQHALLLIPLENFDMIGKVESLNSDLITIRSRISPGTEYPVTSVMHNATGASGKLQQYYDDELIKLVREIYREDFEAFDYSLDFPT